MKKDLFAIITFLSFFISLSCCAQPVLTAAELNPVIGDQFIVNTSHYVLPGYSGANQTWDLTTMSYNGAFTYNAVTVASTGYASTFPNANIAFTDGFYSMFYNTSSSSLKFEGNAQPAESLTFTNPEELLHFPLIYNTTYSDSFYATKTYLTPRYWKGKSTVMVDGYGTLKTPAGTFSNTLRVKTVMSYTDSLKNGGVDSVIIETYRWYLKNNHYEVAMVYNKIKGPGTDTQSAYYLSNVVGIDEANARHSFSVFPNPASNELHIRLKKQCGNIAIQDISGRVMRTFDLAGGYDVGNRLNLSGLACGMYSVHLEFEDKSTAATKLIITK